MSLRILAGFVVATSCCGIAEAQFSLFLPNGAALAEGNSSNVFPWGRGASAIRQQSIYDSANFTAQGVNYPIVVLGARWRANGSIATWTGGAYSSAEVSLSTAAVDQALAVSTFANNRGNDYATVFNGSVTYVGGTGNGTGVPGPNIVDLTFATPFVYDPSSGNDFLCEVTFAAGSWGGGTTTSHDVITTGSQSSRVFNSADPTQLTGTVTPNHGCVMELVYVPQSGLYAGFDANVTTGATPLTVNFSDRSYSSDPNGVQTWAWDLDGDALIDSNAQNPSFTYSVCGAYNVSLTVTDAAHPSSTFTRNDYIFADPQLVVAANFTASPRAGVVPVNVTFSDLSTGSPTAWLWDFDGDNVPDSSLQNPSFRYTVPGVYTVTLIASNACFSDTETKTSFIYAVGAGINAPADLLCYQMNEVRGNRVANVAVSSPFAAFGVLPNSDWQRGPGAGRTRFDANEPGFGALSYSSTTSPARNWIQTGAPVAVNGDLTITWWARRDPASTSSSPFGYFFGDASFRCFFGSAGIIFGGGSGTTLSTTYTANFQGHLIPGVWNHYAIVIDDANGINTMYENGVPHATPRTFAPNSYTYTGTANLIVAANSQTGGSPSSAHYDMDDFRIYGSALSQADIIATMENEYASNGWFDAGCAGGSGVPVLNAPQRPTIPNATYTFDATNLEPGRPAALILGTAAHLGGILPLDLSGALGAGCTLGVLPEFSVPANTGAGSFSVPLPLPLDPLLNGFHGYAQVLVVGSLGATSNALDVNLQIN